MPPRRTLPRLLLSLSIVLLLTAAACSAEPDPTPTQTAAPTRIMIVGDSITHGSNGAFTWRYRLFDHLRRAGASVDFVGPRHDLLNALTDEYGDETYAEPDFDQDHNALWGRTLAQAATRIRAELTADPADDILLLLGSNDLGAGLGTAASLTSDLRQFVGEARAHNPRVRIIVGHLLPLRGPGTARVTAAMDQWNSQLSMVAASLSTAASPVTVAVTDTGYDRVADNYDLIHPSATGEYKIAAGFADALAAAGLGAPFGPIPENEPGPSIAPVGNATVAAGRAFLGWTASPGATVYEVKVRNVTRGETAFRSSTRVFAQNAVLEGLEDGSTYEFVVVPSKWFAAGAPSVPVSFSPSAGAAPPGPPAAPVAVADGADREATIRWAAVSGADGYYVSKRPLTFPPAVFAPMPVRITGLSQSFGSLVNGQAYQFTVRAYRGNVPGPESLPVTVVAGS